MVITVLTETGVATSRIVFEITERIALSASDAELKRLKALQEMGARVALDDFGTGYFGFSSLRALPIDSIKINRTYI